MEKSVTTTKENELVESQEICTELDEAIFYNFYNPPKTLAKPKDIIGSLIHILVAKGLLDKNDVKRILKVK